MFLTFHALLCAIQHERLFHDPLNKYPDILPAVRDAAYNTYLKAQGIDDGIKNYDRVIMLVHAWKKSLKDS